MAKTWADRVFEDEVFDSVDLSGIKMEECSFSRCSSRGTSRGSALTGLCTPEWCDSADARPYSSERRGSAFPNCGFEGASLEGVALSALDLRGAKTDTGQAVLLARSHGAEVDLGV